MGTFMNPAIFVEVFTLIKINNEHLTVCLASDKKMIIISRQKVKKCSPSVDHFELVLEIIKL